MRALRGIFLALALAPGLTHAQEGVDLPLAVRSPVLVLDTETLFARSEFGRRVQNDITAEGQALIEENDRIEAELTAEELLLTSQREELSADEFRALADAFDEKVQRIRAEQDAKARAVGQGRDAEQRQFRQLVTPIIARIMQETGAAVVIERDQAVVWADVIDITPTVLEQVDRALGAGPGLQTQTGDGTGNEAVPTPAGDDLGDTQGETSDETNETPGE